MCDIILNPLLKISQKYSFFPHIFQQIRFQRQQYRSDQLALYIYNSERELYRLTSVVDLCQVLIFLPLQKVLSGVAIVAGLIISSLHI